MRTAEDEYEGSEEVRRRGSLVEGSGLYSANNGALQLSSHVMI